MKAGFPNDGLLVRSTDGRNSIVEEHLIFRDPRLGWHRRLYRTQPKLHTDGGSLPPLSFIGGAAVFAAHWLCIVSQWFEILLCIGFAVCVIGIYLKFYGRWWFSYILHDGFYQDKIEISDDYGRTWRHHTFTERESNWMLKQAMRSQGAWWWEYTVVFKTLKAFGWRAFDEDRAAYAAKVATSNASGNSN